MDDNLARRRRVSAAAELGANASLKDGEAIDVYPARESHPGPGRVGAAAAAAAWGMERRNSVPPGSHQRHMPMEPLKMTIPRKNKEKKALFHYVSTESREYEDMMTILNASYLDTSSAGCFTYCKPRLVQSELLEKEFVEKRREMKSEGRTEKELEESYCFLLADNFKLPWLCEKGLLVGQSRITVLGNPNKGVYLSRYSDLLQVNSFTPGATGEILIFKVMKGKVKSMYENMKNLQDPTPRFDSHISKNASKVTSLTSYRAFELTQHYFYEYTFDELRQRPRQVCPYAVLSFQFKGKDSALTSKPLAPIRLNSQSAEGRKEPAQFIVWTGDLVKGDTVLYQISLRSLSPPFLPHKLPEKLEIGWLMRLNQVTKMLPAELFSYNLYNGSQEVMNNNHFCSLLEVTDRNRATTSVTSLLQELEINRVVLVTPLTERGFLILLSSVQMATPTERGESWKRCLQALFVFPQSRDVTKSTTHAPSSHDASESLMSAGKVMPRLTQFIPALHHALVKARANPPPQLSTGVEHQAREYLTGLTEGKVRQYPMGNYESNLDEEGKLFPPPKHHRVNMDSYLNSYLYNPALYLLSVARVSAMVEAYCGPEEPLEVKIGRSCGGQREVTEKEATSNRRDRQTNTQKIQQLIDLVQTCKRNAENEINMEEGGGGGVGISSGRKRRLEQETAVRAIKFLKASQEPGRHSKIPVDGNQVPASPGSLASVISLIGLRDVDLREDGSELAAKLLSLLTALIQTARETATQEEVQKESFPFDKIATKLGLPTNCDIDLRKHDDLEEQMAGSVSSLEGFSPGSHSGEMNHHGAAGRGGGGGGLGRRAPGYDEEEEQWAIPWVLIPITGLCSERYTQRDRNIPQDPRFQHLTAPSITTTTKPSGMNPTPSPEPSLPLFPFLSSSPEPSPPAFPSQCPSPDPSPPPSPSQCPSPEPSPPASPSQCPSPEPSPLPSPSQCPSPQPSPSTSPSQYLSPKLSHPPSPSRCQPPEPDELSSFKKDHSGANEELLATAASREFTGVSQDREEKPQGKEKKNEEPPISASSQPSIPPAPERRKQHSLPPTEQEKEDDEVELMEVEVSPLEKEEETRPVEKLQMQEEEEEAEVVEMIHVVGSDEEQKGEAEELLGSSSFSVTSPRPCPLRHIDSIVDKHLGDFSSEMQDVLQEESVHYSFPQSPHSTSNTDTAAVQHTLPRTPLSQFSQYVSFYNPCPPVQDYVDSLQDSINSMLTELGDSWPSHKPAPSRTNVDAALANTVSAFVSSIRAANLKTGIDDSDGEVTAADVSQTPALSREQQVWQPHSINKPNPTDSRNPPNSHITLSVTTSAPGSLYKPSNAAVLHSPLDMSPQSNWNPQQSCTLELGRTVTPNTRKTQDDCLIRTVHFTPGADGGSSVSGTVEVTLPGFSDLSKPSSEASHTTEPVSSSASVSVNTPVSAPAADLSSLISQLQPEVFNNLVEIIKDVKRNSLQFYLHSAEREDRVHEDIKEHLLKQGNVEQSPVTFLNQENSDSRLLVIIKNKDIAGHLHKIPGLVSLKRHPSVVFVGIDTLDDIRNNSYNELFVSGGCIVSDELVLNPDFMSHDRLTSLLRILEQHSSPESLWRWKIHHKTHKKLKEQSRFRRDAANLLDILSAYQKRQIVEFLPYHHCDTTHQSPDLNCLMELQARYTQYRHTVLLTEQFEKFPAYSSSGIIVATIEEILHDFTRLVGYHQGNKSSQPIMDDILASKESAPLNPGKKAVAATLEFIHSALQTELEDELRETEAEGRRSRERREQRDGTPVRKVGSVGGNLGPSNSDTSITSSHPNTATVTEPSNQTDATSDRREKADQHGAAYSSNSCPAEGDTSRDTQLGPDQPVREEAAPCGNSTLGTAIGTKVTGSTTTVTDQKDNPNPAVPRVLQIQLPQQHRQNLNHHQQHLQQSHLHLQQPPHSQQRGANLLQPPHLPHLHNQHFSHSPLLGPLTTLGGGLLGPTPVWPGAMGPTRAAALVWGFPGGRDFTGSRLMGGYHNPAGQGSNMYRGGQRGGGFNGM
ncbi:protein TASOR isoform 3-T3 [Acanthopagrus schlegelii]